jgi:hypothetical protein
MFPSTPQHWRARVPAQARNFDGAETTDPQAGTASPALATTCGDITLDQR